MGEAGNEIWRLWMALILCKTGKTANRLYLFDFFRRFRWKITACPEEHRVVREMEWAICHIVLIATAGSIISYRMKTIPLAIALTMVFPPPVNMRTDHKAVLFFWVARLPSQRAKFPLYYTLQILSIGKINKNQYRNSPEFVQYYQLTFGAVYGILSLSRGNDRRDTPVRRESTGVRSSWASGVGWKEI